MALFLEAFMSKPVSSSGQPIPVAILVSGPGQANKAKRLTPKRKSASATNQLPWLWIATGGCTAWIVVVLVIAAASLSREPEQAAKPNAAALAKLGAVEPAFQAPAAVQPANVEPDLPGEADGLAKVPAPKLPMRDFALEPIDEAPPLIVPKAPPMHGDALAGKNADDKGLFANCQQIGTNVLFMRDPPEAFKRARAEKKMVFVVHLSGNLEDKEFT
jgi:hypothetical protein